MFILKKEHQPGVCMPLKALFLFFFAFIFSEWNRSIFLSVTSDYRVQCPRVGLQVKI